MNRSSRYAVSVWITVIILALVALLASGLAAVVPALISRDTHEMISLVSAVLPTLAAVLVAGMSLWASRLLIREARRASERELELAQMHSELALAQKVREQRHDLLNHLTVISALIQTGSSEQALAYLRRVIYDEQDETGTGIDSSGTEPGILPGLLGQKLAQAARMGVHVDLSVENQSVYLCIPDVDAARIVGNLADNAIEAASETAEGTGKVTVEMVLAAEHCSFRVWNSGPIIPPDKLKRIFDAGKTTKGPGHRGLGLHIVRELVRAYGGSLTVRSDEGSGTEFAVSFDRPQQAVGGLASRASRRQG